MTLATYVSAHLTDEEIASICRPLKQPAAQIRFLESLHLRVDRRPDGTPLVRRSEWDRQRQEHNPRPAAAPKWGVHS